MHIFLTYSFLDSLKRDGVTSKNVKLIGHGFLSLVDNLFWYLPFASIKQAHGIREKAVPAVTEENWAEMYAAITAEHYVEGAREQLAAGWKKWLAQQNLAAAVGAATSAAAARGGGPGSEFLDDQALCSEAG